MPISARSECTPLMTKDFDESRGLKFGSTSSAIETRDSPVTHRTRFVENQVANCSHPCNAGALISNDQFDQMNEFHY